MCNVMTRMRHSGLAILPSDFASPAGREDVLDPVVIEEERPAPTRTVVSQYSRCRHTVSLSRCRFTSQSG